jgi:choline dehydrogenase-like flavoprotein
MHRLGAVDVALVVRAEQAPNPESRVLLAESSDALGVPRVKLDWRTLPQDVTSVRGLVEALGRELDRLGLGRVEVSDWLKDGGARWRSDPLISMHPIGGYHHMGTTRMSDTPAMGVTDRDGRVHGIANLFVAGSSLFPTSGWANPTLTIVALALRTADRIAELT